MIATTASERSALTSAAEAQPSAVRPEESLPASAAHHNTAPSLFPNARTIHCHTCTQFWPSPRPPAPHSHSTRSMPAALPRHLLLLQPPNPLLRPAAAADPPPGAGRQSQTTSDRPNPNLPCPETCARLCKHAASAVQQVPPAALRMMMMMILTAMWPAGQGQGQAARRRRRSCSLCSRVHVDLIPVVPAHTTAPRCSMAGHVVGLPWWWSWPAVNAAAQRSFLQQPCPAAAATSHPAPGA